MFTKIIDWFSGKKMIIGLIGLNIMQLDLDYWLQMNQDLYKMVYYPVKFEYTRNDTYPLNETRTVELFYEDRNDHFVKYNPIKVDRDRGDLVIVKAPEPYHQ